jgi:hypothetical protein
MEFSFKTGAELNTDKTASPSGGPKKVEKNRLVRSPFDCIIAS